MNHKPNPIILFYGGVLAGLLLWFRDKDKSQLWSIVQESLDNPWLWLWCAVLFFLVIPSPFYWRIFTRWIKRNK